MIRSIDKKLFQNYPIPLLNNEYNRKYIKKYTSSCPCQLLKSKENNYFSLIKLAYQVPLEISEIYDRAKGTKFANKILYVKISTVLGYSHTTKTVKVANMYKFNVKNRNLIEINTSKEFFDLVHYTSRNEKIINVPHFNNNNDSVIYEVIDEIHYDLLLK